MYVDVDVDIDADLDADVDADVDRSCSWIKSDASNSGASV